MEPPYPAECEAGPEFPRRFVNRSQYHFPFFLNDYEFLMRLLTVESPPTGVRPNAARAARLSSAKSWRT
jgi:hypothetical protein